MRASLLIFLGSLASCTKPSPQTPSEPARPAPAAESPSATLSLFERLAREGEKRDQADPSTTKVIDALTAAGLSLSNQRQLSAASGGASYCVMFSAAQHVTLSICEFADPQSAKVGAESSRVALKEISGRSVDVKRSTMLAVIDSQADEASAAIKEKARRAFEAL